LAKSESNPVEHPADDAPRVLVIDDSPDVHRLLQARLRTENLTIDSASTSVEGLKRALAEPPALILLDIEMPEMDGFEVLRALKDNPATLDVPVIILSGHATMQDKVTAFDLGAVDYVTKPFEPTELRVRVRSALRLACLVQMLAQRAQIDGLTGLWNRVYFDARCRECVSANDRHGRALSICMIDADHFKGVNDTFGHPAGDAVLQGIADTLRRQCRTTDIPCRFGGEEFAILLPETGAEDARILCERIREAIEKTVWSRHPERSVTVSIGLVGSAVRCPIPAEKWVESADKALYAAKSQGRNRTVMADLSKLGLKIAMAG
jgi:diguanylate cyclase (GGDEF)-like protein